MMKVTTWLKNGLRREIALDQRATSDITTGVGVCWEDLFYPLDAGKGVAIASQPLLKNGPDEEPEEPLKPGPADFSVITVVAPEMLEDVDHVDADGTPFFYGFEGELLDLTHVWRRARLTYTGNDPFAATVCACNLELACYNATSMLPKNNWKRIDSIERCLEFRKAMAESLRVPDTWLAYSMKVYEGLQTALGDQKKGAADQFTEMVNTIIQVNQADSEKDGRANAAESQDDDSASYAARDESPVPAITSTSPATTNDDMPEGRQPDELDPSQLEDLIAQVAEDYPEEPDSWDNR